VTADGLGASFTVMNTGRRAGSEIAEVYAAMPEGIGEPPKRLVGWSKVELAPGETKTVKVTIDPVFVSVWDEAAHRWVRPRGAVKLMVGGSSAELPLAGVAGK
jgi:beta-glucosidase